MASAAAAICKQLLVSRESSPKVSRSTLLASLSSQLDAILLNNNSSKDIADIKIAQRLGKAKETLQLLINPDHLLKSLLEDLKSVGIDGETSSSDSENNQHHQIITAATTSTIIKSSASSSFITTQVVADPLTDNERKMKFLKFVFPSLKYFAISLSLFNFIYQSLLVVSRRQVKR